MDDLIAFLRARLDEDEQTARAASDGWYLYDPEQAIAFVPVEDTQHIARHTPARVLAEVDAKRRILNDLWGGPDHEDMWAHHIRLLALPYADHPDYRDEWRPQA
ncbi:DUF6221 family protein [Streptomyces sp. P9(2023)]|uniref:DUF6221 family protein n=1 Tax=Streptomyces sp. P9(2023) TaxID=3064394 RepID=UPI0028F44EC2|nr:DUF6221 family protein [Streptomyces sp. P9(2023)]MDT9688182.1 DUF6221 family protein [Streptomyces sp. P9(2023)]